MIQTDALRAVLDEIDRLADDVVETLATLVHIPSVTPKYPGIDYAVVVGGETRCNLALRPTLEAAGCAIDPPICQTLAAAHVEALGEPVAFRGFAAVDDATYLERGGATSTGFWRRTGRPTSASASSGAAAGRTSPRRSATRSPAAPSS